MENADSIRTFKLGNFEGPLDLLLFLINKNEVNIYDIPVSELTDQYIHILNVAEDRDLDDMSEFHLMATTLLFIKSRMLLPVEIKQDDQEDPRQDLITKLVEYQKFKKLSGLIEERSRNMEWIIERKKVRRLVPFIQEELWQPVDPQELLQVFSAFVPQFSPERIIDLSEEVSVNEKIALLSELLEQKNECTFTDLLIRSGSLMEIICAFFAILESAKMRLIQIYQHHLFGDILIRKSNNTT
jgi:segregation and condensation protein A